MSIHNILIAYKIVNTMVEAGMNWGTKAQQDVELDTEMMVELWRTIKHIQMVRGKSEETAELTANVLCYAVQRGLCTAKSVIMRALEFAQTMEKEK